MPNISAQSKQILSAVEVSVDLFSQVVIAYSGGLDSSVLLHACAQLKKLSVKNKNWMAVYIDHQLSKNSNLWQQHCQSMAEAQGFPFRAVAVDVDRNMASLEAAARGARYAALETFLEPGGVLLTAHHADDQAETVLLRLMRGAGVAGLRGIHRTRHQGNAILARPLLDFSRQDLMNYAQELSLSWIEDESNDNTQFDRNFLRRDLIPILKQRWPDAVTSFGEVANHSAEQQSLLEDIARSDLEVIAQENLYGYYLDLAVLQGLGLPRAKNAIKFWVAANGGSFNREQWRQFEALIVKPEDHVISNGLSMIKAKLGGPDVIDSDPSVIEVEYRAYDNKLYIYPVELLHTEPTKRQNQLLKTQTELYSFDTQYGRWELGVIDAVQEPTQSLLIDSLELALDSRQSLNLQTACSFDVIQLNGKSQQLKKIFQARRVPQWWRASYPAISCELGCSLAGSLREHNTGDQNRLLMLPGVVCGDAGSQQETSTAGEEHNRVVITWDFKFSANIRAFFDSLEKYKNN